MWNTLFHYEARKVKELQRSAWDVDQILYGSRLAAMFTERRAFIASLIQIISTWAAEVRLI